MSSPSIITDVERQKLAERNALCDQWSDERLVFEFCEQYSGDADVARIMLAATLRFYVESKGEQLGRRFWRTSTSAILLGKGMGSSPFDVLHRELQLGLPEPQEVEEEIVDVRVGSHWKMTCDYGSLFWPPECRLKAGDVVQVASVDLENEMLGVFLPAEPLRGGADLGRGIGGWWIKERLLLPL